MSSSEFLMTLTQHIMAKQALHPDARGQFSSLMTQIGVAGKIITAQVRRAGIIELWGSTGAENVQGESVQKLDRIAQDTFVAVLSRSGCVAGMASEEEDDIIQVPDAPQGDYVVVFDPLDGSSNIDVNVSIGTIFAIYKRRSPSGVALSDFLRPGRDMVGAGYIIYGSSTALVYSDGHSVDLFTLDPSCGEFFLTKGNIRIQDKTTMLSVNECNEPYWPAGVKAYVDSVKARNLASGRTVSSRHIGSLVADVHRNMLKGGVYLYPADKEGKGKLRILYECNPLAFIVETAGGAASDGKTPILDLTPSSLHQRSGLVIGSKTEVAGAVRIMAGGQ